MARMRTAIAMTLAAALSLAVAPTWTPIAPQGVEAQSESSSEDALDRVVLRSGRVVEGRILEVTDTEVEMVVIVAGIEAPTTYPRTDVLEILRGVGEAAGAGPAGEDAPAGLPAADDRPEGTVIYRLPLRGHLLGEPFPGIPYLFQASRRDVISFTPFERAMEDAKSYDPEAIIIEIEADSPGGFDGLFVAEGLAPIFEQAKREGHRVVVWVESAVGGAAFLPMMSSEMYFKPDGVLGGIGDLGNFDMGDSKVNEKQISLRLGHAEGIAIQNGYDPVLVRAMAREQNWLAVRWEGGRPVYIEHEPRPQDGPGWTILSDDGEGDNADSSAFEGNDVLNLDADMAQRLTVSKGTADNIDDLVFQLGVRDDYTVVRGKGGRVIEEHQDRLARAVDQLQRLFEQVEEGASGRRGGRAELGRRLRSLEEARSILTTYAEVLDPTGAVRSNIDVQIEATRQQIRDANASDRGRSGPSRIRR